MAYIPKQHERYGLLPLCRKRGGEVFSYPPKLIDQIDTILPDGETLIPYGYSCYEEYDQQIEKYRAAFSGKASELDVLLTELKKQIQELNVKENWVVARYLGPTTDAIAGLTHGRCYYWPCSIEHPVYEGVIDDEEFTSYMYPTDPELWEVLEDPLKMTAFINMESK